MKKALWALPLAATLALAGCSGTSPNDENTQPSPATAADSPAGAGGPASEPGSTEQSSPGTESDAASPDPNAASGKQLSADELVQVAEAVEDEYGKEGAQILPDADLKASAPMIGEMLQGMKVDPAECGVFAMAGMSEMLDRVNLVTVVLPADANDATTSVNIGSYDSADVIEQMLAQAARNSADCSEFSLTMQGQEASAVVETGEASTSAATTLATITDVDFMGQKVTTLTVAGYDGQNTVSVNVSQPKDLDAAVQEAEKYIDLALLHMGDI